MIGTRRTLEFELDNGTVYPDFFEVKDGVWTLVIDGLVCFVDVKDVLFIRPVRENDV